MKGRLATGGMVSRDGEWSSARGLDGTCNAKGRSHGKGSDNDMTCFSRSEQKLVLGVNV